MEARTVGLYLRRAVIARTELRGGYRFTPRPVARRCRRSELARTVDEFGEEGEACGPVVGGGLGPLVEEAGGEASGWMCVPTEGVADAVALAVIEVKGRVGLRVASVRATMVVPILSDTSMEGSLERQSEVRQLRWSRVWKAVMVSSVTQVMIAGVASGAGPGKPAGIGWVYGAVGRTIRFLVQHILLFPILRFLTPHAVRGAENLRGLRGPLIVVANHVSHLDTPVIVRVLPPAIRSRLVVAAAKDYFYSGRLRGALVSVSLATVPFDRSEGARGSLAECEQLLRSGRSLLIFPEGTRSSTGRLGHVRSGVSVLAAHTNTPVLPMFIHGLVDVMPKGTAAPMPGGVVIDVGELLLPDPDGDIARFRGRVESALVQLGERRPQWGAPHSGGA